MEESSLWILPELSILEVAGDALLVIVVAGLSEKPTIKSPSLLVASLDIGATSRSVTDPLIMADVDELRVGVIRPCATLQPVLLRRLLLVLVLVLRALPVWLKFTTARLDALDEPAADAVGEATAPNSMEKLSRAMIDYRVL